MKEISWDSVLKDPARREKYLSEVQKTDRKTGSFLSLEASSDLQVENLDGSLNVPVAVKDNIAVKDQPLTCASKMLENLTAPYTATSVLKLQQEGAVVIGKTNLDEFGMGSSTEHSALGETSNPWDTSRVPGGSSGGSAAAVAADLVPLAIGTDTGGSVRQPANFCGVYGLKPTYGVISRYGLTAYASSLEVIGSMSKDIDLLEKSFNIMSGRDGKDQSSVNYTPASPGEKTAAVMEVEKGLLDDSVAAAYADTEEALKKQGYRISRFKLKSFNLVVPSYYTIATAEASANLARYNGIRYGHAPSFAENPAELMRKARHEGFGDEVKLRILLGTYVLRSGFQDQYYGKAQKVRTLIRKELSEVFRSGDIILMPVFPTQAFLKGEGGMDDYRQRVADVFTCLANLAGLPALSVPAGTDDGLPLGVQFMAPSFGEERLFSAARSLAEDFPLQDPPIVLETGSFA